MIINRKLFNYIREANPQLPHSCLVFKYARMSITPSGAEMARFLGVSKQAVYNIEKGLRKPSEKIVKKICSICNDIKEEDFYSMQL